MSVINELVNKSSQIVKIHLNGLKITLPKKTECKSPLPPAECASSKKKDKPAGKSLQRLCQQVNKQVSSVYVANANDQPSVPQPVLDNIKSAISQCLKTHPMCSEVVKPQEIPLDDVKEAIEKYIKLPKDNDKSADYANCDVIGEVKDNSFQICVSINFYTTQNVNCHSLNVKKVMGMALDNSAVNIQIEDNSKNCQQQAMITRL